MTRPADPPAPQFAYTLESLASYLGLGNMSAERAWLFLAERERLLRGAMSLLETHKSNAATAEDAIRERIAVLSRESPAPREAEMPTVPMVTCPRCGRATGVGPDGEPAGHEPCTPREASVPVEALRALPRHDYRWGGVDEMGRREDGDWVRWEDVADLLAAPRAEEG